MENENKFSLGNIFNGQDESPLPLHQNYNLPVLGLLAICGLSPSQRQSRRSSQPTKQTASASDVH
jgi:hypothetical protein